MTEFDKLLEQLKYFIEKGKLDENDSVEITFSQAKVLYEGIAKLLERQSK